MTFDEVYIVLKNHFEQFKTPIIDLMAVQNDSPYRILVATILSTRTKDETTAKSSQKLFEVADSFDDLEKLSEKEIAELIFPVGFYNEKAKHLKQIPKILREKFGGEIPQTIDELLEFPGVGRKVANLILISVFNKPAICVDTHVHRIFNRFGYIKTKNPTETEMALRKKLPEKYWLTINGYMVSYGQDICKPISPKCDVCEISEYCRHTSQPNKIC
jgi:endonuclease III